MYKILLFKGISFIIILRYDERTNILQIQPVYNSSGGQFPLNVKVDVRDVRSPNLRPGALYVIPQIIKGLL